MIVLDGRSALSPFRLDRLNERLARVAPGARVRGARFVYFADAGRTLDPTQHRRLAEVLDAGEGAPLDATLWIVPRLGTLSPWSSKASDILHDIGLPVRRVERGTAFLMEGVRTDDTTTFNAVAGALHDPMTQSVLTALEQATGLFLAGTAGPLHTVALGNDPRTALQA